MQAIEVNLDIYVGSALDASVSCYQDEARTSPFDFTGYTGQAGIFDDFGDTGTQQAAIVIAFNAPATDGEVHFTMAKADTATLIPGEYVWDALLWASSAEEEVWFRGVCRVHAQGTVRGN